MHLLVFGEGTAILYRWRTPGLVILTVANQIVLRRLFSIAGNFVWKETLDTTAAVGANVRGYCY